MNGVVVAGIEVPASIGSRICIQRSSRTSGVIHDRLTTIGDSHKWLPNHGGSEPEDDKSACPGPSVPLREGHHSQASSIRFVGLSTQAVEDRRCQLRERCNCNHTAHLPNGCLRGLRKAWRDGRLPFHEYGGVMATKKTRAQF